MYAFKGTNKFVLGEVLTFMDVRACVYFVCTFVERITGSKLWWMPCQPSAKSAASRLSYQ